MTSKPSFSGSKWWKFDFHTHTPESNDYSKDDESLKNIEPEKWLQKAMESGLDCVAVTDHNTGGWIDKLKAKNQDLENLQVKPGWYRKLIIFPGVEITVGDSNSKVHLLAIFDPGCDSEKVSNILALCGITNEHGNAQDLATNKSFLETVGIITEANGIAIPAHIDRPNGLLENITTLPRELKKSLEAVSAAEISDLHKFDKGDTELVEAVGRLAKVAGSDAHKPDNIGKHFSWIKMSQPSIEGLRLALSKPEFYVKNQTKNPTHLPDVFLSRLMIKNMQHCGRITDRPFHIQFHPHFNSIIGGRGAGKSTILESIRIATRRDQNLSIEAPRVNAELKQFMELSKDRGVMLSDTEILLELHRHGKDYRLRWRHDGEGAVLEQKKHDTWQEIEGGDLKERFPISIFSQKQINELALNPRGLLAIIDRSPEVNFEDWNSRWNRIKSQLYQSKERDRELLGQLAGEPQIRLNLEDIENKLKQYEEKGHGEILAQYQRRSQEKNALPNDQVFESFSNNIRDLATTIGLSDFPAHLFNERDETTAEIQGIHHRTEQNLETVSKALNNLADKIDAIKTQMLRDISASKWNQALGASIQAYDELVKEYEESKSQFTIGLYKHWVDQRNRLQQQVNNLSKIRAEVNLTEKETEELLVKLLKLRGELFEKRQSFLQKVVGNNKYVRMELVPFGDVSTVEDYYRTLLELGEDKFVSSVYDSDNNQGLLWELINWEDTKTPVSDLPKLILVLKTKTFNIARGQASDVDHRLATRLKKLHDTQPGKLDRLDTWWPEDMLRVKYSKDPTKGKFDNLEKGSAGQKAAAILAFLLSHGSEPLIIDQPEDDLDNALTYDLIVTQIHANKSRRQLVIVTHNPNIVVNGDSELVHVLKYEGGQVQIHQQGGLEDSKIRELICTIMEGGKEAFDSRYARIRGKHVQNN